MKYFDEGWKQGKSYISYDLGGEDIKHHYENMLALPKSGQVFKAVLDAGLRFPDWQQMHAAYFKQGYLLVISLDNYNDPDLLKKDYKKLQKEVIEFYKSQQNGGNGGAQAIGFATLQQDEMGDEEYDDED